MDALKPNQVSPLFTYLCICLAGVVGALYLFPDTTAPVVAGGTSVYVHSTPLSARSTNINFFQARTDGDTDAADPKGNTVDLTIRVAFSSISPPKLVNFQLTLPEGVKLRDCGGATISGHEPSRTSCTGHEYPKVAFILDVATPVQKDKGHFFTNFTLRFAVSPALNVGFRNGHVTAILPHIQGQSPGTQTQVNYATAGGEPATVYDWSGRIPDLRAFGDWNWTQNYAESTGAQVVAMGIDPNYLTAAANRLFIAGALIGVVGAALIAALQHIYRRA